MLTVNREPGTNHYRDGVRHVALPATGRALRLSSAALAVAISRSNLGDQLARASTPATRTDHDCAVFDRYVDGVAFIELRFARNGLRKTETKAVAHFETCVVVAMYLH